MQDSPVAQVETCHGIERHPFAIFRLGKKIGTKRAERLYIDMFSINTRFRQPF
jgi:hypothetical protein